MNAHCHRYSCRGAYAAVLYLCLTLTRDYLLFLGKRASVRKRYEQMLVFVCIKRLVSRVRFWSRTVILQAVGLMLWRRTWLNTRSRPFHPCSYPCAQPQGYETTIHCAGHYQGALFIEMDSDHICRSSALR